MSTMTELMREYYSDHDPEDDWIRHCRAQAGSAATAEIAATARDGINRKHPHQYRLPNVVLGAVGGRLRKRWEEIKSCPNFDAIHAIVVESKVSGFGAVAAYDTALRIGHCRGKLPERVYLHAGTRVGAGFYGIEHAHDHFILPEELPTELRRMQPYEVEDFLCIYKSGKLRHGPGCAPASSRKSKTICPPGSDVKRGGVC